MYEELLIKSFVVAKLKTDDETKRADVRKIVAAIDNWANCDMFVARCKFIGKDRAKWFDYLTEYLESDKEYDLRFAIVAMMTYYLTDEYIDRVLALSSKVKSDKYYVKMAVAWLMATALCKFPDKALDVIKVTSWTYGRTTRLCKRRAKVSESISRKRIISTLSNENNQKRHKKPPGFFPRWLFFEDYIIFLKIASTSFLSQICGQGYKGLASCRAFVMQSSRSSSLMSWLPSFARILSGMFMEEFISLIH